MNFEMGQLLILQNGQIFVFRGMVDMCLNDDQLAIILSHEMAHAVLNHGVILRMYRYIIFKWTY